MVRTGGPVEPDGHQYDDTVPVADQIVAIAEKMRGNRIASALDSVGALLGHTDNSAEAATAGDRSPQPSISPEHLKLAMRAYDERRARDRIFPSNDLFGEPAWDILLDLYIAYSKGKAISVSSACSASHAPATTALRWLGVLAERKMVVREADDEDHRRVLVSLSATGLGAMERYFERLVQN